MVDTLEGMRQLFCRNLEEFIYPQPVHPKGLDFQFFGFFIETAEFQAYPWNRFEYMCAEITENNS